MRYVHVASTRELSDAVVDFCALEWSLLSPEGANLGAEHGHTWPDQLPHRCFEVVYMTTLLREGFGFPLDSRNILFALELDGMEVEWTLGYALASRSGGSRQ